MHHPTILAALTAALASIPSAQASMYTKSSPVLQVNARTFDTLIAKSNYTSIVEFYAPWCGHCKNLKPAYEKAAKNLDGLAKVAAVDCDDDANKPLCSAQGVSGFPTIKIFRPGKKAGKPVVEDYKGPRTATSMTEEVVNKINNHVTKVTDKDLDAFVAAGEGPKALLFTEKGTTSALLRSLAIDFLDVIKVGQVRNKEKGAVEKFGIEKYPTLVLLPGGADAEPVVYTGELKKSDMVEFLKQAGEPNPDPAPAKSKGDKKKAKSEQKPGTKKPAKEETSTAAEPEPSAEPETPDATTEEAAAPSLIPITTISSYDELVEHCFQPKAHTCLLASVPAGGSETGDKAIATLSELNTKYIRSKRHAIPFFAVPADVEGTSVLRTALALEGEVEIVAVNVRRKWYRQYEGDFGVESVEAWLDSIRLGQSAKRPLPDELIVAKEEATTSSAPEAASEESEATEATEPTPEAETAAKSEDDKHDEL